MIANEQQLQALAAQAAQAVQEGKACVVTGLILNGRHELFVMKRAATRSLFPNCWDLPGGHVDPGETLTQALAREIYEETGWQLKEVGRLVHTFDWDNNGRPMREFCYLVTVVGDLHHPHLETDKFSTYRWVGTNDLELLKENREAADWIIFNLAQKALMLD